MLQVLGVAEDGVEGFVAVVDDGKLTASSTLGLPCSALLDM